MRVCSPSPKYNEIKSRNWRGFWVGWFWFFFEEETIKISGYKFTMTVKRCVRFWDGLALCQSHSLHWTMCWLHEPFLLYAAISFICLSSHKLNKCHVGHSVPSVTSAVVCLDPYWISIDERSQVFYTECVLRRVYTKYRHEKRPLLEIAALKQFVQTYLGRSFSYFRDV